MAVPTLGSPRCGPSSSQRLWPEALGPAPPCGRGLGAGKCDSGHRQARGYLRASVPRQPGNALAHPRPFLARRGPSRRPRTLVSAERGRRGDPTVQGAPGLLSFLLSFKQPHLLSNPTEPLTTHVSPLACGGDGGAREALGSLHCGWKFEKDLVSPGGEGEELGKAGLSGLFLHPWWAINPLRTFAPALLSLSLATPFLSSAILNHTLG